MRHNWHPELHISPCDSNIERQCVAERIIGGKQWRNRREVTGVACRVTRTRCLLSDQETSAPSHPATAIVRQLVTPEPHRPCCDLSQPNGGPIGCFSTRKARTQTLESLLSWMEKQQNPPSHCFPQKCSRSWGSASTCLRLPDLARASDGRDLHPARPPRQAEEFDGVVWGSQFWQVTPEDRINLALNCISLCMGVPPRSSLQAGTPRPRGLDFHLLLLTSVSLAGICPEWGWPVIGLGWSFSCCNDSKDLGTLGVQETEEDTAPHRAVNSPAKHKPSS